MPSDSLHKVSAVGRRSKVLAVDLDGTILHDKFPKLGSPIPGMREELEAIRSAGWKIAIWTVRDNVGDVRQHLEKHGIPFDYINENPTGPRDGLTRKIFADVYLDDRALPFNGDAGGLARKVLAFKEWHRRSSFED